ncbi:hypothetical protein ASPACDRAFT_1860814 [Aspergillus aculeatus ATCC 16872]|uniref:Zn(2)-C6 fungal-type domain-containing protein n=1 Tax=Aspergillus aculeatus (strain ATCC 16872 / CBS 172.66 / WB 5094) TaxID=690307 RepID=A0A1L9WEK0_ASPA1|nr:uncharacterized protein ASPACDRAFT_1860814 [Aspergillus aculeatus ATCC 16872]OJJ94601.1 hypothetical protein ASPACDRAFT_1860814 [Aspergillus aculeatus ATCC 16872]
MHLLNKPRRSHRKSRYGCAPCKRCHVKCDEKRPSCTRCLIRGQDCTYLIVAQRRVASDAPLRDRPVLPSPCTPDNNRRDNSNAGGNHKNTHTHLDTIHSESQASSARTHSRLHEMHLFHHALMVTAPSLANDDLDLQFWQMDIPRVATTQAFVMDGLLAVAALHLAYVHPEQRTHWTGVSLTYQIAATTGLREELAAGLDDGLEAKFAGSALILLLITAYPVVCGNSVAGQQSVEKQGYTLDTVQSIRSALEGCAIMYTHIYQDQNHCSFDYWLRRDLPIRPEMVHQQRLNKRAEVSLLHSELQARLHHVRNVIERGDPEPSLRDEYQRACDLNLWILDSWPAHRHGVVWPLWVSKAFLDLCGQGEWTAHILLMFYGLTLHLDSHVWFISGAGKQLISSVLSRMRAESDTPPEWAEMVCWVRRVIDV